MNADFWKKFARNKTVQRAVRRFAVLAILIPGSLLALLKSSAPPFVRVAGSFAIIVIFMVLLKRANNAMNDHRRIMDDDADRRSISAGKQPRQRRRWLNKIFPFYT